MQMKRTSLAVILALAVSALLASPAGAQTNINSTTLSAAVSPTDQVITLAAVTCTACTFGPGTKIFVNLEEMEVSGSYVTGTTVPVIRAMQAAHPSGATVFYGPAPRFHMSDPPVGACNKTLQSNGFYPWFNLRTGAEWLCDNGSVTAYTAVTWRVLYPYAIGTQAASR